MSVNMLSVSVGLTTRQAQCVLAKSENRYVLYLFWENKSRLTFCRSKLKKLWKIILFFCIVKT